MMPMLMQLASHETNAGTEGYQMTGNDVTPHFDHCGLINAMVSFTLPMASQRYVSKLFRHV